MTTGRPRLFAPARTRATVSIFLNMMAPGYTRISYPVTRATLYIYTALRAASMTRKRPRQSRARARRRASRKPPRSRSLSTSPRQPIARLPSPASRRLPTLLQNTAMPTSQSVSQSSDGTPEPSKKKKSSGRFTGQATSGQTAFPSNSRNHARSWAFIASASLGPCSSSRARRRRASRWGKYHRAS